MTTNTQHSNIVHKAHVLVRGSAQEIPSSGWVQRGGGQARAVCRINLTCYVMVVVFGIQKGETGSVH